MARKPQDNPQLDMTPMIDVVFELIIFFVVTIKQEDLFSHLNANRPAPGDPSTASKNDNTVTIEIGGDWKYERSKTYGSYAGSVILYNSKPVKIPELDSFLRDIARTSKTMPIIVKASRTSPHKALMDVLDVCYKNELFSVSIFTL